VPHKHFQSRNYSIKVEESSRRSGAGECTSPHLTDGKRSPMKSGRVSELGTRSKEAQQKRKGGGTKGKLLSGKEKGKKGVKNCP